jgi:hypothetical protein
MLIGLLAGLLWFGLFLGAHLSVIRWARPEVRARINQQLFLTGLAGMVISLWPASAAAPGPSLTRGGLIMAILCGSLSYVGLFVLYMPFYYTVIASLSVRTMILLHRQPRDRMPIADLREEFVSTRLVRGRLAAMTVNGFLVLRGDAYTLSSKGRWIAGIVLRLKRLWALGAGG